MIIDDNFNNNGNHFKNFRNSEEPNVPKKLHRNNGTISRENSLLTKDLSEFGHTDPANSQAMGDKAVAMLHQRYKNRLVSSNDFNKKCTNIAKNRH